MAEEDVTTWSSQNVAEWLCLHGFCDEIQNQFKDEGMNGVALKDLHDCDFQGLDLGLLGLLRFKEQLAFKKCLLSLFKKNEFQTPKKAQLSPIQSRNVLTNKKFIREALSEKWPGNNLPTFGKGDEENRKVLDHLLDHSGGDWETPYFSRKDIFKHCVAVMKERRRKIKKGFDYTQPHGNSGKVRKTAQVTGTNDGESNEETESTDNFDFFRKDPEEFIPPTQDVPNKKKKRENITSTQVGCILKPPSPLQFSGMSELSPEQREEVSSFSKLQPPSPMTFSETKFSEIDVTIVNSTFIVCCYENVKKKDDITTSQLNKLCQLLKLGHKSSNRSALFVSVAKALVKRGYVVVDSLKPSSKNIKCVKKM